MIYGITAVFIINYMIGCSTSNDSPSTKATSSNEKKRMEIKFSCEEDGINEYLEDGWVILKKEEEERICTWKEVPATKDCDMEKDKGCKITKPDK